jgi:hypothetical protein
VVWGQASAIVAVTVAAAVDFVAGVIGNALIGIAEIKILRRVLGWVRGPL